jgi:hypothetical protein
MVYDHESNHGRDACDDDYPYDDEDAYCHRCDNRGFILVCIDDMCRGAGECMHGDGEIVCPDCKGESAW